MRKVKLRYVVEWVVWGNLWGTETHGRRTFVSRTSAEVYAGHVNSRPNSVATITEEEYEA